MWAKWLEHNQMQKALTVTIILLTLTIYKTAGDNTNSLTIDKVLNTEPFPLPRLKRQLFSFLSDFLYTAQMAALSAIKPFLMYVNPNRGLQVFEMSKGWFSIVMLQTFSMTEQELEPYSPEFLLQHCIHCTTFSQGCIASLPSDPSFSPS